jgi:(S)-ureidoglycine aminohydrolase
VTHLGQTRSVRALDHLLQTPETFVRAPLPGMQNATAVVHIAPAIGARFVLYTAELERGGRIGRSDDQRFLYVLDGAVAVGTTELAAGGYAYVPGGDGAVIAAASSARVAVFEKPYEAIAGLAAPVAFTGLDANITATFLNGDPDLEVRALVPDSAAFDFRVNTMTFRPGASLSAVEVHVMEHGLMMLDGGGIYRLGSGWYPVEAGDVIWMAAYCPQWFGAIGKSPARYLIYKDWDRHPR